MFYRFEQKVTSPSHIEHILEEVLIGKTRQEHPGNF